MMKVYVKLFATLAKRVSEEFLAQHPEGIRPAVQFETQLPEGGTLEDLVALLGLPKDEVRTMFVNGRARKLDHRLTPEDQVGIFPPVGGG